MCGICGAYNLEDKALLEKMAGAMLHRGPDDCGYFTDKGIMLGHRRLSIIDLTTGKQPISNEDGSITVVFNGEIYNFQELRSELEGKGHRFATKTDTEVIVHAYEEHGPSCVKLFNGMFAFALWDGNKKQLMLARDRYGIKPLYYAWVGDSLVFASEAKPILLHPDFKRRVDLQALHLFINLRYIPGDSSIFQGIRKLPHSHYALVKNGKMELKRYFQLQVSQGDFTEGHCSERLLSLLKAAVKRHMIADVPVGVYLSGGLDSSTITALASEASDEPLRTFSMGFGQPDDEFADARVVAEHFGTEHKEISIKASVLKDFPKILWYMGTPKRNVYPYYLAQAASRHVKVIQSGLGGDELFGGYTFKYNALNEMLEKRKQAKPDYVPIRASIAGLDPVMEYDKIDELNRELHLNDDTWSYLHVTSMDRVYDLGYLGKVIYGNKMQGLTEVHDFFKPYFKNKNGLVENAMLADFGVKMADDFLAVDDGTSMANSLETRVPFLDNGLVEFAFSMPTRFKLRDGSGKYILRKTMAPLLPKAVLEKKKQGFATNTIAVWEEEMMEYAKQRLLEGSIVKEGYVKKDYVEKVLRAGTSKRMLFHYNTMWNLLAFEVWHNVFMEGGDISRPPKAGL